MQRQYRTPKRRHSSLFQRMQEDIERISKKLSAAKQTKRQFSYEKINRTSKQSKISSTLKQPKGDNEIKSKAKQRSYSTNVKNYRKNIHFDDLRQPSVIQTVRIKHMPDYNFEFSPKSGKQTIQSKTLNRRLNFGSYRENQQQKILKLERQNQKLSQQIEKLEFVCQDQSYRLGYTVAYFEDRTNKMQIQNETLNKENIYLKKLYEHYKLKCNKYKDNLKKRGESVESD